MAEKRKLFGATYEQSKNLFSLKNVKNGGGFGQGGQAGLWGQIKALFILGIFGGVMIWVLGAGLSGAAKDAINNPADVHFITVNASIWMGNVSQAIHPLFNLLLGLMEFMLVINVLIPKTMPFQILFFQVLFVFIVFSLMLMIILPLGLGSAISSMGWIGMAIQLILGLVFLVVQLIKATQDTLNQLYGGSTGRGFDFIATFDKFYQRFGGILIVLVIVNSFVFKIGLPKGASDALTSLIIGWIPLLFLVLYAVFLRAIFRQMVSNVYFVKYRKQYKEDFGIEDRYWYGKFKAKRLAKRRAKQTKS